MAVAAAIYYNIFMLDHENSNLKRKEEGEEDDIN